MADFIHELRALLSAAGERGLVGEDTASLLLALAEEKKRPRGFERLAMALALIGAFGFILGLILVVGANWRHLSPAEKFAGFFVLFIAFHGCGLWLRWKRPEHRGTAEALNFAGGGFFLGGVALVAQVYHIDENPLNGVVAWFIAVFPLALLLRSTPLAGMALAAGLVWLTMRFSIHAAAMGMKEAMVGYLACLPFVLAGLGAVADRAKAAMGAMCRISAPSASPRCCMRSGFSATFPGACRAAGTIPASTERWGGGSGCSRSRPSPPRSWTMVSGAAAGRGSIIRASSCCSPVAAPAWRRRRSQPAYGARGRRRKVFRLAAASFRRRRRLSPARRGYCGSPGACGWCSPVRGRIGAALSAWESTARRSGW